jgi:hypothetical protein
MPFRNLSLGDVMDGGKSVLLAGLEGGKVIAVHGRPALGNSVNLAAQVGITVL